MPNEFEKQVKQKLDELKLVPGEPVWKVIEEQIREKKDRRAVFLWLVLLLLLAGGGIWIFSPETHENDSQGNYKSNQHVISSDRTARERVATSETTKEAGMKKPASANDSARETIQPVTRTNAIKTPPVDAPRAAAVGKPRAGNHDKRSGITFISKAARKQRQAPAIAHVVAVQSGKNDNSGQQDRLKGKPSAAREAGLPRPLLLLEASGMQSILPEIKAVDAHSLNIVSEQPAAVVQLHRANALRFGLIAGIGISGVQRGGGLSGFSSGDKALNASAGGSSQNFPVPVPTKRGLSFRLGLAADKSLSRHWSLNAAFEYSYFSTTTMVGQRIPDTVLFSISQPRYDVAYVGFSANPGASGNASGGSSGGGGTVQRYRNKYEFASVPVMLGYSVGRTPLRVYGGLTLQYLVHSTALQYDATSNIYFYDRAAFNRWQWAAVIGLNYPVLRRGRLCLDLGPEVMIGSSLQNAAYPPKHLFAMGLTTRLLK